MGWTSRPVKTLTSASPSWCGGRGRVVSRHVAAKVDEGPMTPERVFPASSKCKKCHIRANEEYEESTIARAIVSPRSGHVGRLREQGKGQALCLNCHAPQSVVFPDLVDSMVKQSSPGT